MQECCTKAVNDGENPILVGHLLEHFYEINEGLNTQITILMVPSQQIPTLTLRGEGSAARHDRTSEGRYIKSFWRVRNLRRKW